MIKIEKEKKKKKKNEESLKDIWDTMEGTKYELQELKKEEKRNGHEAYLKK